jgi:hypothetical protein
MVKLLYCLGNYKILDQETHDRIEVYKAANPHLHIKVYFLIYDNSAEEQKYLTSLRKEKEAFEKLIMAKSKVVIPIDETGNVAVDTEELFWKSVDTRAGGGGGQPSLTKKARERRHVF